MQPDHARMEARMQAALWRPETPEGLGQAEGLDRRFAVYRNNVQHGLTRALAARFPVIERLVGPEFFTAVARLFAAAHPPASPVLSDWGAGFPSFLRAFPPAAALVYLPEVAELEWVRGLAFHAADAPMGHPAALGSVDPARLILRLAPSVQAFAATHPAVSIWAMNQPGAQPKALPKGPEYALIARDPGFALITVPLAKDQHAILTALLAGRPLGEAAQTDPTPLLALLLRHRLIARIEEQP